MIQTSKTVVFFGSGPVAAHSLELLRKHANIEAVITKPSTLEMMQSAAGAIPVHCVNDKTQLELLIAEQKFSSMVGVLVDFGIIVSQQIIASFELGIVNSHFSLLPEWRGADPITFAILSGQKQTGVSLMLLVEKMDEGPIINYGTFAISPTTTTPELTESLITLSDELLRNELPKYLEGQSKLFSQDWLAKQLHVQVSYSRKLEKSDGILDWSKPAVELEKQVRAFAGWPRSRCKLANKDVIITTSRVIDRSGPPGTVLVEGQNLIVCCGTGALLIERLQPSGKREMDVQAFLAGHRQLLTEQ